MAQEYTYLSNTDNDTTACLYETDPETVSVRGLDWASHGVTRTGAVRAVRGVRVRRRWSASLIIPQVSTGSQYGTLDDLKALFNGAQPIYFEPVDGDGTRHLVHWVNDFEESDLGAITTGTGSYRLVAIEVEEGGSNEVGV